MAQNSLVKHQPKFSVAIQGDTYKNLINQTLGDPKRAQRFTADIMSVVSISPAIQECEAGTVLSCALLGESLALAHSPQLGHYYMVPFKCKAVKDDAGNVKYPETTKAQFQLGYKGYIQLAIRTGQYEIINVIAMKSGELKSWDPLNEVIVANLMDDEEARENAETTGYYAIFKLINGFRKAMYWSKPKMEAHAMKYSKGYAAKKGYTFWEKDFDGMAFKTMLRQLISKWGIMSIEMQDAYEKDMAIITEGGNVDYVDNDDAPPKIEGKATETKEKPEVKPTQDDDPFGN